MKIIRQRLPQIVFDEVFTFILRLLQEADLLHGKAFGIDATTLEANAAMKSIVRKDNGEDWKEYLRRLAAAEGIEDPSDEDLRRLDRRRKGKKVSNKEWQSATDPDRRITKMKDGRTHLAYKAEHTVQLDSQAIVSAHVTHADQGDGDSSQESLILAQAQLIAVDHPQAIEEAVMDKGYHVNGLLGQCQRWEVRTYIPERRHVFIDDMIVEARRDVHLVPHPPKVLAEDVKGVAAVPDSVYYQDGRKVTFIAANCDPPRRPDSTNWDGRAFEDMNPDTPPEERFKYAGRDLHVGGPCVLLVYPKFFYQFRFRCCFHFNNRPSCVGCVVCRNPNTG